jgi:hypothetical protein
MVMMMNGEPNTFLTSAKLNQLMVEIQQFSDKTFGDPTQRDCTEPLKKLKDELEELLQKPDDNMEWADCMLLLLDAARRKGITPDTLFDYCLQKLEINKNRVWMKEEGSNKFSHKK